MNPQRLNYNEMEADFAGFCRKLRLVDELYDKYDEDESLVRNRSKCASSRSKNKILGHFCEYITKYPYERIYKYRPNLSKTSGLY